MPWRYDPNHSYVGFAVQYLGIVTIKGRFTSADVALTIDEEDPCHSTIEATIQTESLVSDWDRRDQRLKEDYLDVVQFPTMHFVSRWIEPRADRYAVIGDLTIHGVTKEAEMAATFHGEAVDGRGNTRRGFSATTTVSRLDYQVPGKPVGGMEDVGELVEITLEVSLNQDN